MRKAIVVAVLAMAASRAEASGFKMGGIGGGGNLFANGLPFSFPLSVGAGYAGERGAASTPVLRISVGMVVFDDVKHLARPRGRLATDVNIGLAGDSASSWSIGYQHGVGRFLVGAGLGWIGRAEEGGMIVVPEVALPLHRRIGTKSATLRFSVQAEAVLAGRAAFGDRVVGVMAIDFF